MWRFTGASGTIDVPRALSRCFVEGHLKDEFYPFDPDGPNKPPRLILARNDLGKALYGVFFEPLNTNFFRLDQCPKHLPWVERPAHIDRVLLYDGP